MSLGTIIFTGLTQQIKYVVIDAVASTAAWLSDREYRPTIPNKQLTVVQIYSYG